MPRRQKGRNSRRDTVIFTPLDLGLNSMDLTSTGAIDGNRVDLSGFVHFQLVFVYTIVGAAPSTGTADINLSQFAVDGSGTEIEIIDDVTLGSLSSTESAATYEGGFGWGASGDGVFGTVTRVSDTLNALQSLTSCRFQVNRSTGHDAGTSMTGDIWLIVK